MLEPGGGGGGPVVVEAQELRILANAARSARSAVDFALSRVAGTMGLLDHAGFESEMCCRRTADRGQGLYVTF